MKRPQTERFGITKTTETMKITKKKEREHEEKDGEFLVTALGAPQRSSGRFFVISFFFLCGLCDLRGLRDSNRPSFGGVCEKS